MKSYWFVYEDENRPRSVIRIRAKRKPGPNTIPKTGTWVLQEWVEDTKSEGLFTEHFWVWRMPAFPEITWGRLSKMRLARKVEHDHQ